MDENISGRNGVNGFSYSSIMDALARQARQGICSAERCKGLGLLVPAEWFLAPCDEES